MAHFLITNSFLVFSKVILLEKLPCIDSYILIFTPFDLPPTFLFFITVFLKLQCEHKSHGDAIQTQIMNH